MTYCCISQGSSHGSEQSKLLPCIWSYMISFEFPVIMDRSLKFYSTFQCELWSQCGNCVEAIFQLYLHRTTLFTNYLVCASKEDIVYICIRVFYQQYGSIWLFFKHHSNSIRTSSSPTVSPAFTCTAFTFPDAPATNEFCIFMASTTNSKANMIRCVEHVRYMCCILFCW